MTAGASLIVALLAFPIAFLATHDLYVTLLAPTYGLYAAGQALQWVCAATLMWSLLTAVLRHGKQAPSARSVAFGAVIGSVATILVWGGELLLVQVSVLARWHYDPLADSALLAFLCFALSGLLAGIMSAAQHRAVTVATSAWRDEFRQHITGIAWYAFALALVLEIWISVASTLGWN